MTASKTIDLYAHTRHVERLFILGAGFSRSISDAFPVTAELLEKLFDEDPDLSAQWAELSTQFGPFLRLREATGTPEITTVLTALEAYRQVLGGVGTADAKIRELQARVLYAAGSFFTRVSRDVVGSTVLADFVRRLRPEKDAVLTMNWDIALELELQNQGISYQYDVLPSGMLDQPEGLLILKPQGSASWCRADPLPPHTKPVLHAPHPGGTKWILSERTSPATFANPGLVRADPAIVPPGFVGADRGSELDWSGYLLRVATWAAIHAKNIVVVGYSLPSDDFHILSALSFGLPQDSTGAPVSVYVIDPSTAAFQQWRQAFQGRSPSTQPVIVRHWARSLVDGLARAGGPWG